MKHHILHEFRGSTIFKEKFSDHFKNPHTLMLMKNLVLVITWFVGLLRINCPKKI